MRTVVGVLRGGPSSEYEVSLKSGASVLGALDTAKYEPRDIFIDRSGQWHARGVAVSPEQALRGVDVVLNAMHGHYGEDGEVQKVLDALAVPYTGSGAAASALAFNKARTKQAVKKFDIKTPRSILVSRGDAHGDTEALALAIFRSFPHPVVVKPAIGGSSVATTIVNSYHMLVSALEEAFKVSEQVLVEEFIRGREATVGVIDNFRGEKTYALFPIEIIPPASRPFFDYHAKYSGETIERVPGNFTAVEKEELIRLAKAVHEGLGLSHYSRSDFILSRRGIYFLEVNTLPGLTAESLLPKAVAAVGSSLTHFLDHVVTLAKDGKRTLLSVSHE
ncbi:MAG TPA: D-alanine--D-alanine ligase [Candidatus Paceibacterota bacterium]|nr:D-alanine--D-alanine ligase [Candidatus Paceibacterota bacterium]